MTPASILIVLGGFVALTVGADMLVRSAADIAARLGVPPLVIGLTVVAFGTSSPEVAVSVKAVLADQPGVALGNVVGSNIFNVLLVIGVAAIAAPLAVNRDLLRLDVPVMIGVSALPLLLGLNGSLVRGEGLLLVGLGVAYTVLLVYLGLQVARSRAPAEPGPSPTRSAWLKDLALLVVGFLFLAIGAEQLVVGAVQMARALGVSELMIGLTIIAAGTSLPEVATSLVATLRGERDIAVGNVVGSNIFNVLIVLGVASIVAPGGIDVPRGVLTFDFPVMIAVSIACLPVFLTGWTIDRFEGGIFLSYYALYMTYLGLTASGHEAQDLFGSTILYVLLPLTAATLFVFWYRGRAKAAGGAERGQG